MCLRYGILRWPYQNHYHCLEGRSNPNCSSWLGFCFFKYILIWCLLWIKWCYDYIMFTSFWKKRVWSMWYLSQKSHHNFYNGIYINYTLLFCIWLDFYSYWIRHLSFLFFKEGPHRITTWKFLLFNEIYRHSSVK